MCRCCCCVCSGTIGLGIASACGCFFPRSFIIERRCLPGFLQLRGLEKVLLLRLHGLRALVGDIFRRANLLNKLLKLHLIVNREFVEEADQAPLIVWLGGELVEELDFVNAALWLVTESLLEAFAYWEVYGVGELDEGLSSCLCIFRFFFSDEVDQTC